MTVHIEYYTCLREEFLSLVQPSIDHCKLLALKEDYAESIDSTRKLSYVKDLKALIRLLEKREILSYDNIEPLWYISKKFANVPYLQSKLADYKASLQQVEKFPRYNMYQDSVEELGNNDDLNKFCGAKYHVKESSNIDQADASQKLASQHQYNLRNESTCSDKETALMETVLLQISERLGRSWRDVARHLGVRECEIDAIQSKYPFDLKEQSYQVLKSYVSTCVRGDWKINLIKALEKGRRRDLRELAEEIILQEMTV